MSDVLNNLIIVGLSAIPAGIFFLFMKYYLLRSNPSQKNEYDALAFENSEEYFKIVEQVNYSGAIPNTSMLNKFKTPEKNERVTGNIIILPPNKEKKQINGISAIGIPSNIKYHPNQNINKGAKVAAPIGKNLSSRFSTDDAAKKIEKYNLINKAV